MRLKDETTSRVDKLKAEISAVAATATAKDLKLIEGILTRGEVIMFGEPLWPRVDDQRGEYDFVQLCAAVWTFRDLDTYLQLGDKSPAGRAIMIRNLTRWLNEYFGKITDGDTRSKIRKTFSLIHTISVLMKRAPDGECRMPYSPHVEDRYAGL